MAAERVTVREVGLRDGLQSVSAVMPTDMKRSWLSQEHAAGIHEFEASSFVPARLLPQLADADAVIAHALTLKPATITALVPNLRGAERALAGGAHKIIVVISASESHNVANVRCSIAELVAQFRRIVERAREGVSPPVVAAGISVAFGCSLEGEVPQSSVLKLAAELVDAGAQEITLADTVGFGGPRQTRALFAAAMEALPGIPLAAHFHDTRGLGLANVYAALDAGIRTFDASLAGLGGCPHAPGATGNIVTEDLVFLLETAGFDTGIDLDRLIAVRSILTDAFPDEPLHGALARAGRPVARKRQAA